MILVIDQPASVADAAACHHQLILGLDCLGAVLAKLEDYSVAVSPVISFAVDHPPALVVQAGEVR